MPIPESVRSLVERFKDQEALYTSDQYNETRLRIEFLNPFFEALGWDVANRKGLNEGLKDVVHEANVRLREGENEPGEREAALKAPDYAFRIGGAQQFFVEAKKPAVNLSTNLAAAFQTRRYAWSDPHVQIAILSDFQEFAVYDGRIRPFKGDRPEKARLKYLTYHDYEDQWDWIAERFSFEAVQCGALDQYAAETKDPRGIVEPGDAFLNEIEGWREALAGEVARNHPMLTARDLNAVVQRTIDRIVFLRIAEDRKIEPYGELRTVASAARIYPRLVELFRETDRRYNSGLFHLADERGRPGSPDTLTPTLQIGDDVLKPIIDGLYYPDSPYAFNNFPADLLGQVYERFLGKVVRLENGRAVVEDKPEVKKAGGVYYTPTYVVEYIVRQTLTPLFDGKTPTKAASVAVLDPACGSGSFLLGAYDFLLRWYLDRYTESNPERHAKGRTPRLVQTSTGDWRLSLDEKKRILRAHLYGVDIDDQAVEVTKLSLLLRLLQGETAGSLRSQLTILQDRILPELADNVKSGNSLIGPDFYDGKALDLFTDEDQYQINVFDWAAEFPAVVGRGGFDAVIGNPPYLNVDDVWGQRDPRLGYLKTHYAAVYNDKTDLLFYFLAQAVRLSKGSVGFIVSRAFLEAYKADKLRRFLAANTAIREIVDFQNHVIFKGVGITTAVVVLDRLAEDDPATIYRLTDAAFKPADLARIADRADQFSRVEVEQAAFGAAPWGFAEVNVQPLLDRIDAAGTPLEAVAMIGQGMQTGRNGVFGGLSSDELELAGVPADLYLRRARNSDIQRYAIGDRGGALLYVEDVPTWADLPAFLQTHLLAHEDELKKRAAYQRGNCEWWRYTWPLHKEHRHRRKLYSPYLAERNRFALDDHHQYQGLTDTTVVFDSDQPEDLLYLLGLLNSRLLTFRFRYIGKLKSAGIYEYFWNSISRIPIRRIDFGDPADVARHTRLVALVTEMITLQRTLAGPALDHTATRRRIANTDNRIDALVYNLYGLSPEDIALVEGAPAA